MKIKRKGLESGTVNILGAFVIVGFTVWIIMKLFTGTTAEAATSLGSLSQESRYKMCELSGKKFLERGQEVPESIEGDIEFKKGEKGDGFPDECDLCLGGDDRVYSTIYYTPLACYKDPIKNKEIRTYKDMCKARGGCYISDKSQCCLLGKDKCGEKCK